MKSAFSDYPDRLADLNIHFTEHTKLTKQHRSHVMAETVAFGDITQLSVVAQDMKRPSSSLRGHDNRAIEKQIP